MSNPARPRVGRKARHGERGAMSGRLTEVVGETRYPVRQLETQDTVLLRAMKNRLGQSPARGQPGEKLAIRESIELQLGQDIVVPDLAAWRGEQSAIALDSRPIAAVPLWVCELVTCDTARLDRVTKKAVYCREKVEFLWYVDASLRTLETCQWINGRYADLGAYSEEDRVREVPFDAIELDLGALWADFEAARVGRAR